MSFFCKKIYLLVLTSGLAALSWEIIWQIKAGLALGVSAYGTALTLAITMGGMSAGALLMGNALRNRTVARPLRLYGSLEFVIGACGLLLIPGFQLIESFDTWAYGALAGNNLTVHCIGIALMLGIPTMCMGATMPVLGLIARQAGTSVAGIYGLNTLGAACGTLLAALLFIPAIGISHTAWIIAGINFIVGGASWIISAPQNAVAAYTDPIKAARPQLRPTSEWVIVAVTGFATFVLEVAWFRSLTAAFNSTTVAFAVMLSAVLLALGLGAKFVPWLKKNNFSLGLILATAGCLVLIVTPIIERFDMFVVGSSQGSLLWIISKFFFTIDVLGLPMLLIGVALPWILDDQHTPRRWGNLYSLNALSAIIGALSAAWILLPTIGFAKTAWVAGILLAATGILFTPSARRLKPSFIAMLALGIAITFESGVGSLRAQGWDLYTYKPKRLLESYEGPDVTASAVEYEDGTISLIIDGFAATTQARPGYFAGEHYMVWMGHLPMLLHPAPRDALVICFGTGQTANALRKEDPASIDIVDINKNVFRLAGNFTSNENILDDRRVHPIVMDGRAYIRRVDKKYDVITLEPMPPTFAGVNALYSREFYALARERLTPDGIIAQWLPFHLVDTYSGASIARTMQDVFPNSVLWIDPHSKTGIIIGSKNDKVPLAKEWPGFDRVSVKRSMSEKQIRAMVILDSAQLQQYGAYGDVITDDNQLLAYRKLSYGYSDYKTLDKNNQDLIKKISRGDF